MILNRELFSTVTLSKYMDLLLVPLLQQSLTLLMCVVTAISAKHQQSLCKFDSNPGKGVFDITLCDQFCQDTRLSSTQKTDSHDITEILQKVELNTNDTKHSRKFTCNLIKSSKQRAQWQKSCDTTGCLTCDADLRTVVGLALKIR